MNGYEQKTHVMLASACGEVVKHTLESEIAIRVATSLAVAHLKGEIDMDEDEIIAYSVGFAHKLDRAL